LDVTPEVQKFKPVILYMTQRRAMTFWIHIFLHKSSSVPVVT
jgi:hypothetical protein